MAASRQSVDDDISPSSLISDTPDNTMSPVAVQHPQQPPSNPTSRDAQVAKRYRSAPAKTFQCTGYGDCRMVFSRSEHLARHVRKHTGERPFTCHCSKQFSRLDNLRQHAQTVHSDKQDQNDAMMRELTALHTSMSAAHKASSARSKRSQPQSQSHHGPHQLQHQQQQHQQQQAVVGLGINMHNLSKVEDALFERNISAANLHNLNYIHVGSSTSTFNNNNSNSNNDINSMRRLSVSTTTTTSSSSRTSPSYSPPPPPPTINNNSSSITSSYLPPRAHLPPTPPITPPSNIPFVTPAGTPFEPQQQQQQQHQQQISYPLQETTSPFLPPSPFSPPPPNSLPVAQHPHTVGHPQHHLQQQQQRHHQHQQQQQQQMYGQAQLPQPHSRRSLPLSPQPSPEGYPYHHPQQAEMALPQAVVASSQDRALHHVQAPLQRRISPPGILSPPDLDLSAAAVVAAAGWALSPSTSTSYQQQQQQQQQQQYGNTTTTSPLSDNNSEERDPRGPPQMGMEAMGVEGTTTATHRARLMSRAGSTIVRFPSTHPHSPPPTQVPGTPLSASVPTGINGLGYGRGANGALTTPTPTATTTSTTGTTTTNTTSSGAVVVVGGTTSPVVGNPTTTMDVGMDGYANAMDLGLVGMDMGGMMGIDGMGMMDMDMGLVVGDMDMRAALQAAAEVDGVGRVLAGHRPHRVQPMGVVKKEKAEEEERMALHQQRQRHRQQQELDPRQELTRGRPVDGCLSWNCATMTDPQQQQQQQQQEGGLYPYPSRQEIADLRRREEGLRVREGYNDKYNLQQQFQQQQQQQHQQQQHLDPRQREGLRTMSSGEQVEAEFLNSMMNGLNGMVGGGEVWGAATANNNSNNSSNGGYPPHHHPHPQHPQQQRVRGEVYGVGNGVGVGVGVGLQQGRGSPTEGMRR